MTATANEIRRRLRFVIHWGLVEIRNLAYDGAPHEQIAFLADILEFLPAFLAEDREPDLEVIREQFEGYHKRYPNSTYDYLGYLADRPIHGRF